uniref:Uncharacterized protein n=1 Tax=Rhizophora mucronata TaxID=61149 RepID=A0A2P2LLA0_RHIMU
MMTQTSQGGSSTIYDIYSQPAALLECYHPLLSFPPKNRVIKYSFQHSSFIRIHRIIKEASTRFPLLKMVQNFNFNS